MNFRDPFDGLAKVLELIWRSPPLDEVEKAGETQMPEPVPPPPAQTPELTIRPGDVRAATVDVDTAGAMATVFLGLDVTVMVTPPSGDGLWNVRGRVWLSPLAEGTIRVALVQDQNVLAEETIDSGSRFRFQDILVGEWALEFHFGDGRAVVLRSDSL